MYMFWKVKNCPFPSASVSVFYPEDSFDIDILINKADVAMYNAKEHGGNNYKFFISEQIKHLNSGLTVLI